MKTWELVGWISGLCMAVSGQLQVRQCLKGDGVGAVVTTCENNEQACYKNPYQKQGVYVYECKERAFCLEKGMANSCLPATQVFERFADSTQQNLVKPMANSNTQVCCCWDSEECGQSMENFLGGDDWENGVPHFHLVPPMLLLSLLLTAITT